MGVTVLTLIFVMFVTGVSGLKVRTLSGLKRNSSNSPDTVII